MKLKELIEIAKGTCQGIVVSLVLVITFWAVRYIYHSYQLLGV